jgi:hypothetical protein
MLSSAQVPSAKADDHNTAPNACTAGRSRAPGAARRRVAVTNRYPHPVHSHFLVSRAGTCHTAESRSHNGQARRFQKGDHILRPRYSNCREWREAACRGKRCCGAPRWASEEIRLEGRRRARTCFCRRAERCVPYQSIGPRSSLSCVKKSRCPRAVALTRWWRVGVDHTPTPYRKVHTPDLADAVPGGCSKVRSR